MLPFVIRFVSFERFVVRENKIRYIDEKVMSVFGTQPDVTMM